MSDRLLTIGEMARQTGVATSALRYYEELGLLPAPARISGQRRYPESAIGLVGFILLLRDVGFSLTEQKALMASRAVVLDDWQRLTRRKLAELDEQIAKAQTASIGQLTDPRVADLGDPSSRAKYSAARRIATHELRSRHPWTPGSGLAGLTSRRPGS